MMFSRDAMWSVLETVRDCAFTGMSSTPAGAPQRSCVVPGEIVWDDCTCGLLAVTWRLMGTGAVFPAIDAETSQTNCPDRMMIVQITVASLRCAAGPDQNGNAPTCEQLEDDAFQQLSDSVAVRDAVSCCVRQLYADRDIADFAIGRTLPAGPEGACVGSTLDLLIGWTRDGCCG
jgi:hypothetical protein